MTCGPADGGVDVEEYPDEIDWHEVVDFVCVGDGDATRAVTVAANISGLGVILVEQGGGDQADPTLAGRLGVTDPDTVAYLTQLTDDTGPLAEPAGPVDLPIRHRKTLGPQRDFFGSQLRDWAVNCLASPYGVLTTTPAEALAAPSIIGAVAGAGAGMAVDLNVWLAELARELELDAPAEDSLHSLVFVRGKVAGAVLDTPTGEYWVKATRGVVIATGTGAPLPVFPADGYAGSVVELALVPLAASRFARLELVISEPA